MIFYAINTSVAHQKTTFLSLCLQHSVKHFQRSVGFFDETSEVITHLAGLLSLAGRTPTPFVASQMVDFQEGICKRHFTSGG